MATRIMGMNGQAIQPIFEHGHASVNLDLKTESRRNNTLRPRPILKAEFRESIEIVWIAWAPRRDLVRDWRIFAAL